VNDHISVGVQIESRAGVAAAAAIAAVDGVDCLFVGPSDLAAGYGHLGNAPARPEVQDAIARVFADAKAQGKPSGILAPVEADARRYMDMGATFVAVGSDLGALRAATRSAARQTPPAPERRSATARKLADVLTATHQRTTTEAPPPKYTPMGTAHTTPVLGFIGLGIMGAPMADHLIAAGYAAHLAAPAPAAAYLPRCWTPAAWPAPARSRWHSRPTSSFRCRRHTRRRGCAVWRPGRGGRVVAGQDGGGHEFHFGERPPSSLRRAPTRWAATMWMRQCRAVKSVPKRPA